MGEEAQEMKYCGDCIYLHLKRNKDTVTGEHICVKWNLLHSQWQTIGSCPYFVDKTDCYKLPKSKPPLLSEEDGHKLRRDNADVDLAITAEDAFDYGYGGGAQAQWDIWSEWYDAII